MSFMELSQSSPLAFTSAFTLLGMMVGSFSSDVTRQRVSLH